MQSAEPGKTVNVPAGQFVQVSSKNAPSSREYFPALQSVHTDEPSSLAYFPVSHLLHIVVSIPVELYTPSSLLYVPTGQGLQLPALNVLTLVVYWYVPLGQG